MKVSPIRTPQAPAPRVRLNPRWFVLLAVLMLPGAGLLAQHSHVTAGAMAPVEGSRLYFRDGDIFSTNGAFVHSLVIRTAGPAVGLYDGGPTFTALSDGSGGGFPEPEAALPGTRIALQVVSLDGPEGGSLSFWESPDCDAPAEQVAFTINVGTTSGTNLFSISQNAGQPGADPYGHCHGRRFTTSVPGLYVMGVRLLDMAQNGSQGGARHTPSDVYYFYYQAGVAIARLEAAASGITVHFGTRGFGQYWLETAGSLDEGAEWIDVAGPVGGDSRMQSLPDLSPASGFRFYRLRFESAQ